MDVAPVRAVSGPRHNRTRSTARRPAATAAALALTLVLTACGGGDNDSGSNTGADNGKDGGTDTATTTTTAAVWVSGARDSLRIAEGSDGGDTRTRRATDEDAPTAHGPVTGAARAGALITGETELRRLALDDRLAPTDEAARHALTGERVIEAVARPDGERIWARLEADDGGTAIAAFDADLAPRWRATPDDAPRDLVPAGAPQPVEGVTRAADATPDTTGVVFWSLERGRIAGYDAAGGVHTTWPLDPAAENAVLAQPAGDRLWTGDATGVTAWATDGTRQGRVDLGAPVTGLYPDSRGGAWALVDDTRLVHLGDDFTVAADHDPVAPVQAAAADPRDGAVWFAADGALQRATDAGLERRRELGADLGAIAGLAVVADTYRPRLDILTPAADAALATGQPQLAFAVRDAGTGIRPDSLDLALDDRAVAPDCREDGPGRLTCRLAPKADGEYRLTARIADGAGRRSDEAASPFTLDTRAPAITLADGLDGAVTNADVLQLAGQVSEPATLRIDGQAVGVDTERRFARRIELSRDGQKTFDLVAADAAGNTTRRTATVRRDTVAPDAVAPGDLTVGDDSGEVAVEGDGAEDGATVVIVNHDTDTTVRVDAGDDGAFSATVEGDAGDTITVRVRDEAGNESDPTADVVAMDVPPDPKAIAPQPPATGTPPMEDRVDFLYSGPQPIQRGVDPGTIDGERVAVIRGRVKNRAGEPLPGVKITVLDHPEYGHTVTRADGRFDLAVNGGGALTLVYEKADRLTVQRRVDVPWEDFVYANEAVLIRLDDRVTTVNLEDDAIDVARGSVESDADGSRQATVMFPTDTTATIKTDDGEQQLNSLSFRATEYTVGSTGLQAMPAALPANTAYTYAVELSVDEARAVGADTVEFSNPVPLYLENFLDMPVGAPVPTGFYDRARGQWIPEDNGRVIEILGVTAGRAELDLNGDGAAATDAELAALDISGAERMQLAELYSAGDSLWRTRLEHFSPYDLNYPVGESEDAEDPPGPEEQEETPEDEEPDCDGCIINPQSRNLAEEIPIPGTPHKLRYDSRRQPGYEAAQTMTIPVTGTSVPDSLKRVNVTVTVAGQRTTRTFEARPDQEWKFTWDGRDVWGRKVNYAAKATVEVDFVYPMFYRVPGFLSGRFGTPPDNIQVSQDGRFEFGETSRVRTWSRRLSAPPAVLDAAALGGWTINVQHALARAVTGRDRLQGGHGVTRTVESFSVTVSGVAGDGSNGYSGDGGAAKEASLSWPDDVAVARDGSFYIADTQNHLVRRISRSGVIETIAGTQTPGYNGDGKPATDAELSSPRGVAVGSDGSVYIADTGNSRIRRVSPEGMIETIAGTSSPGFSGDGGPATDARLNVPQDVAMGPNGNVFFADTGNDRVRWITSGGRIHTAAGSGRTVISSGDGGLATMAGLPNPKGLAVASDGALYIASGNRIRRVNSRGVIDTFAGHGNYGFSGDGGPAVQAEFNGINGLALGRHGRVYAVSGDDGRVRRIGLNGTINTVAGGGQSGLDGGPAKNAHLGHASGVAVAPDGNIYLTIKERHQVAKLAVVNSSDTRNVASAAGDRLYIFDTAGRHQATHDTVSGARRKRFIYDRANRLIAIKDGEGNRTRIVRAADGAPSAIVSPYGQRTALRVGAGGQLTGITDPEGNSWRFTYDSGLLTSFVDRTGARSEFRYDDDGYLIEDSGPEDGGWQLEERSGERFRQTTMTSAMGRKSIFRTETDSFGQRREVRTRPDGTVTTTVRDMASGVTRISQANGMQMYRREDADPRFGMQAPFTWKTRLETPTGLSRTVRQRLTVDRSEGGDVLSPQRLTRRTSVNGRTTESTYDGESREWTTRTPEGRQAVIGLSASGQPIRSRVGAFAETELRYDDRGRLVRVGRSSDGVTRETEFQYAGRGPDSGYLESVTGPTGRTVRYNRDANGRVLEQIKPDGTKIEFEYDAEGRLVEVDPPGKPLHRLTYDGNGSRTEYDPPDATVSPDVTRYRYNRDEQLTRVERPGGIDVDISYDNAGRRSSVAAPIGIWEYQYESETGQLGAIDSPGGQRIEFSYDGALPRTTRFRGAVEGFVQRRFDHSFQVVGENVNGQLISFAYDDDGLLTGSGDMDIKRADNHAGVIGTQLDSVWSSRYYNEFGDQSGVVVGVESIVDLDLNAPATTDKSFLELTGNLQGASRITVNGEPVDVGSDGGFSDEISLPVIGEHEFRIRVFGRTSPDKVLAERSVAITRTAPEATDEFSISRLFDRSPEGGVYVEAAPGSRYAGIWWVPLDTGRPEKVMWLQGADEVRVQPNGDVYRRDGDKVSNEDGTVVADFSGVNDASVVEFAVSPGGYVLARTSDKRLYQAKRDSAVLVRPATPKTRNGGLDIATSGWGATFISTDSTGDRVVARLRTECIDDLPDEASSLDYCIDEQFRLRSRPLLLRDAQLTVSDSGDFCYYTRESLVCSSGARVPYGMGGMEYGPEGRVYYLEQERLFLSGESVEAVVRQLPDQEEAESGEAVLTVDGEVTGRIYSEDFQRDQASRIVRETSMVDGDTTSYTYTYDDVGRLSEVTEDGVTVHTYTYDANGNRIRHLGPDGETTAEYDEQDRLQRYGDTTYDYARTGELEQKTGPEGTTTYDYDALGNFRRVELPDATEIDYVIDGRNRRVGKRVDGTLEKGWLYRDALNPVAQTDGDGTVTHRFVYGTKANVPAYMTKDGTKYRFITDHLGSVRLVVNAETGAIAQRMDYGPFGEVITDTNPGFQPFGFAGGLYDRDTGLVRFGARDYDAEAGRWTAKDPIGFAGGQTNLYGYTFADPINFTDPTGKAACGGVCVLTAVGVICGTAALIETFSDMSDLFSEVEDSNERRREQREALEEGDMEKYIDSLNRQRGDVRDAMRKVPEATDSIPGTTPSGPTGRKPAE